MNYELETPPIIPCEPHTKSNLNYADMSHWAKVLHRAGYRQRRCVGCKLYVIWYHRDTEVFLPEITLKKKESSK